MPLSGSQLADLKTNIAANTNTVSYGGSSVAINMLPNDPDANLAIANWYNLDAAGPFYIWHFARTRMENRRAVMNTAGSANQLDALTGSKREALLWAIDDTVDCRLPAVRTSIEDLCGSQNTLKSAIIDSFKLVASNAEKLFATGTGTLASPADASLWGDITAAEVLSARNLP